MAGNPFAVAVLRTTCEAAATVAACAAAVAVEYTKVDNTRDGYVVAIVCYVRWSRSATPTELLSRILYILHPGRQVRGGRCCLAAHIYI